MRGVRLSYKRHSTWEYFMVTCIQKGNFFADYIESFFTFYCHKYTNSDFHSDYLNQPIQHKHTNSTIWPANELLRDKLWVASLRRLWTQTKQWQLLWQIFFSLFFGGKEGIEFWIGSTKEIRIGFFKLLVSLFGYILNCIRKLRSHIFT